MTFESGHWPHRLVIAVAAISVSFVGCGEITELELRVRPRRDDFASQIQPLVESLGCSTATGCHLMGQGDLQIALAPTADELETNYLNVKAHIDLDDPGGSAFLRAPLPVNASRHPTCFASEQSCAYRKLWTWIDWSETGDVRPQALDCAYEGEPCVGL